MRSRSPLSQLVRGFLLAAALDLGVIALIAMLGWWAGWIFLEDFQRAVNLAGYLLIGIGAAGLVKELVSSGLPASQPTVSPARGPGSGAQSPAADSSPWLRRYAFTLIFLSAGGVCLLIGRLLV